VALSAKYSAGKVNDLIAEINKNVFRALKGPWLNILCPKCNRSFVWTMNEKGIKDLIKKDKTSIVCPDKHIFSIKLKDLILAFLVDAIETVKGKFPKEKESKPQISTEPKRELDTKTSIPPTTPSPPTTIPSGRPIGRAELFHTTFRKWIKAEIWEKKYDVTGEEKYYATWGEDGERSGWVKNTQLRQISYFGQ